MSGIEPSSEILSESKVGKRLEREVLIMPKQVEARKDGVKNPNI